MLKDNALRKKLNEMGIRTSGPRAILEKRHTEWVNLWNANCDSSKPRSKREILQDLDIWERSQGTLAPSSSGPGSSLMKKDFDGNAWAASHNSSFRQLIEDAKRKKGPQTSIHNGESDHSNPEGEVRPGTNKAENDAKSDVMDVDFGPNLRPTSRSGHRVGVPDLKTLNLDQAGQRGGIEQERATHAETTSVCDGNPAGSSELPGRQNGDLDRTGPRTPTHTANSPSSSFQEILHLDSPHFLTRPPKSHLPQELDDPIMDGDFPVPVR